MELYKIFKSFKPTITVSHSSFYLSQVSWFFNVPSITLEDTGNMEQVILYLPFTNAVDFLSDPDTPVKHKSRAEQYLKEQIDLSWFLTWLIEEWPKSFQVMKQNPDYQYNFR